MTESKRPRPPRPEPRSLDKTLAYEEMGRLGETVRRDLYAGRIPSAEKAALELLEKFPDSTTAHERMGDVFAAQGRRSKARDEYKKALEILPANADAERKYAEAMLFIGEAERTRNIMLTGNLAELRGAVNKNPSAAASRSLLFPGLGQLYNGEYEKGIAIVCGGFVLMGVAVWGMAEFIASLMPRGEPMGAVQAFAAILGSMGYASLLIWSAWDAKKQAETEPSAPASPDTRP